MPRLALLAALLLTCSLTAACSHTLMPTPFIYRAAGQGSISDGTASVPPASARPASASPVRPARVELFFATDRQPLDNDADTIDFGINRDQGLWLGRCAVTFGRSDWADAQVQSLALADPRPSNVPIRIHERGKTYGKLWTTLPPTDLPHPLSLMMFSRGADTNALRYMFPRYNDNAAAITNAGPGPDSGSSSDSGSGPLNVAPRLLAAKQFVTDPRLPARRFISDLNQTLADRNANDIVIYIHGYNNGFDDAARDAAQLGYYLGNAAVPVVYSWPSRANVLDYMLDRETAQATAPHFRRFLLLLLHHSHAERVHIITHSTGVVVLSIAARELVLAELLAEQGDDPTDALIKLSAGRLPGVNFNPDSQPAQPLPQTPAKIGQILLVAPDQDVEIFRSRFIYERAYRLAENMTIYVSGRDRALTVAQRIVYGIVRLGMLSPNDLNPRDVEIFFELPDIDVVDISAFRTQDIFGHNHHTRNPAASSDILLLLGAQGLDATPSRDPADRGLIRIDHSPFWSLPEDYPTRIRKFSPSPTRRDHQRAPVQFPSEARP